MSAEGEAGPTAQTDVPTPGSISVLTYLLNYLRRRESLLILAFVLLAIWFHVGSDGVFFTPRNLSLLLRQTAIVGIVAAGVLILIVMAEIDLSIGSAVYLVSVVVAVLQVENGWPTMGVIAAALLLGAVLGAWNGMWVTVFGVPSFIVTLGGLLAFRGIGLMITDANTVAPVDASLTALSESFLSIPLSYGLIGLVLLVGAALAWHGHRRATVHGDQPRKSALVLQASVLVTTCVVMAWVVGGFAGIPAAVLVLLGSIGVLSIVMMFTRFGRYCYVVGGNRKAALLTGISVDRQIMRGFIVMGLLYGVAGLLITARLGASTPSTGLGLELDAIAAAVLGGAALLGGSGRVQQALYGALLLATMDNGMTLLNISSFTQDVVKGLVLLVAVASDTWNRKRRERQ